MANYWERPTAEQFNFTPYRPPVEETLGAIAAKTQYYTDTLNRIKTEYDAVAGKEVSRDDSKAKLAAFRESVEPKLKELAKKDLSIGSYRNEALSLYEPVLRDKGLLVDEATTEEYGKILRQAKDDASKNGGRYYNQHSVEYASQMLERYKRESNAENSDYHAILSSTGYMPYNEKAQAELQNFVKFIAKEKVKQSEVDPTNPLNMRVVSKPAYDRESIAALAKETLSPEALQQYNLVGKVEFNRMQLAAKTPEELSIIGSTYKRQYDLFYNEKISIKKAEDELLTQDFSKLNENHPDYKKVKEQYLKQKSQNETDIRLLEKERDDVREEYFTNPANWKLGEAYASNLYLEQKIRNATVALSNREEDVEYKLNAAEAKKQELELYEKRTAAIKEKNKKDGDGGVDPTKVQQVNETITGSETDPLKRGESTFEELKTIEVTQYEPIQTELLGSLDIVSGDRLTLNKFNKVKGNTLITDNSVGISETGLKNLKDLLSFSTTPLPKDASGKVDLSKVTVEQAKISLQAILADKEIVKKAIEYSAYENNSSDELAKYYYQLGEISSNTNNITSKAKQIYQEQFEKHGLNINLLKSNNEIFNFDNPENLSKLIPWGDIQKFWAGSLSENEKLGIANYFKTGDAINLPERLRGKPIIKTDRLNNQSIIGYTDSIPDQIQGMANNFKNAISSIKKELGSQDVLTYNTYGRTMVVKTSLGSTDNPNDVIPVNKVVEMIDSGIGSVGGKNTDRNVEAYDFIRKSGITEDITMVKFRVGTGSVPGFIELDVNTSSLKKKIDEGSVKDSEDVLEKIIEDGNKIRIYLPNDVISEYAQAPDRSRGELFRGSKSIELPSGKTFSIRNTAYNSTDIKPEFSGEIKAVVVDGNKIKLKNVKFNQKNYNDIASVFGTTSDNFTKIIESVNINEIGVKITEQDAIAQAVLTYFKDKNVFIEENGELVLDRSKLEQKDLDKLNDIINNRKLY